MSIQDPIKDPIKPNPFSIDNDVTIIRSEFDVTGPSDEDKLDYIANSLPPFPPSSSPAMEIEVDSGSNDAMPVFQLETAGLDHSVRIPVPALEAVPDSRLNSLKPDQKSNKRKKEHHNSLASVSKRQVLGVGDGQLPLQGKTTLVDASFKGSSLPETDSQDLLSTRDNTYDIGRIQQTQQLGNITRFSDVIRR